MEIDVEMSGLTDDQVRILVSHVEGTLRIEWLMGVWHVSMYPPDIPSLSRMLEHMS